MKPLRLLASIILLAALLAATTSVARAWPDQPPDKAFISGPGIKGDVEITDKETLTALKLGAIEDFSQGTIAKPNVSGEGYKITRYFYGATFNFATLHYYPDPSGGRGYVFFEDGPGLSGDHTAYNGHWFYATPEGDAAMQRLLNQLGVRPRSEAAVTAPIRAPLPAVLLAALAGVLTIVWLAIRRLRPLPAESSGD